MSDTLRTDRVLAWMHPDGRVVPASTMQTARRDGGAILSGLRDYTIPLCDWNELSEARAECERLRKALQQLADNKLSDENCSSVELAGRRVARIARAALGTGKP